MQLSDIRTILVVQLQPFGDVLLNTSCLHALQKQFPNAKIDFLVSKPYDSILHQHPILNELVTFNRYKGWRYSWERIKLFLEIRKRKYDLIIDQQRGTGSAQIVWFSASPLRLGYNGDRWSWVYNLKAEKSVQRYSASMKFDLLAPLGIQEEPYQLYYHIKPESISYVRDWLNEEFLLQSKLVVFSPGSPVARKKWAIDRYAKLADKILADTDYKVIILWSPSEKADADKMVELMEYKAIMAPPTTLNQGAALLTFCSLLICNDGGMNHISVVTQTPSLAIFGPTNPENWCPGQVFPIHHHLAHRDLYKAGDDSFAVSVDEAYACVQQILNTETVE